MTIGTLLSIIGLALILPTIYFGIKTVRSTTLADQARAADTRARELQGVRDEERTRCAERLSALERELAEMTKDRDQEHTEKVALQMLFNNLRAGQ